MKRSQSRGNLAVDPRSIRLSQLSAEVQRLAASLASLAVDHDDRKSANSDALGRGGSQFDVPLQAVQYIIEARQLRYKFFRPDLFADPAWDMLLELLRAEIEQHRLTVSALAGASKVPPTTALRWIKIMTDHGLLCRTADPMDGRRVFLELSPASSKAMRAYFDDLTSLRQKG